MGDQSAIEWTDATWNPTRGCSKVSEGCRNCYAMRQAHRHSGKGGAYEALTHIVNRKPEWTGKVVTVPGKLTEPLSWRKPRRIFVDSMSDLFHEDVPSEYIAEVYSAMAQAKQHTFQVLTKRPGRMRGWYRLAPNLTALHGLPWPLPNVWLIVSVENQPTAEERIPLLLDTPAAVRGLSCEPLLDELDLERWVPQLDWVIVGGESGPGARPMRLAWVRDIVAQCREARTPVFVKQLGSRWASDPFTHGFDRKGGDPAEWPADLRIREYPNCRDRSGEKEA